VITVEQNARATTLRKVMAARQGAQDLLDVGAYRAGANPLVDAAVQNDSAIKAFLQQRMDDQTPSEQAWAQLTELTRAFGGVA
jgi:flagellum-specific ATP synthase